MHFEVGVAEYLPFLKLTKVSGRVYMEGPLAESFHTLAEQLNFTYTLHHSKGDFWGVLGPNGWTGMLGMVHRNEVDMAIGPFTVTYDRWSAFKLSSPVYADNVEILVPASGWEMSLFSVISVFSVSVWIALFISIFSVSLALTITEKYRKNRIGAVLSFYYYNLWNIMSTLLQKGNRERPSNYLHTFLNGLWMLSSTIVCMIFGGITLTTLFIRKVKKIDSIYDLIEASNIQPIIEVDSAVYDIFEASQSELYTTLFQRAISGSTGLMTFGNMSDGGMELVLSGSAAMLTDAMGLKGFMAERLQAGLPCNYWLASEPVLTMWKTLVYSKSFSDDWLRKIDQELTHALESGTLTMRMEREFATFEQCISRNSNELTSLSLEHIKGIFLIWSFGIVFSICILFIEYFYHLRTRSLDYRRKALVVKRKPLTYKSSKAFVKDRPLKRRNYKA